MLYNLFIKFAADSSCPTGQIKQEKQKLVGERERKCYSRALVFQVECASTMSCSEKKKLTPYKM